MSDTDAEIKAKLAAIDLRFRKGSKQRNAARYIVNQNRKMTSEDKKYMIEAIPIGKGTLADLFTELRKMKLHPPKTSEISDSLRTPEVPKSETHVPHQIEYATKEDFKILKNSINYLVSVIRGEAPLTPSELESVISGEALSSTGETEEEKDIQRFEQEELIIQDGSRNRLPIYVQPMTEMFYDATADGHFGDYLGTQGTDPFAKWKKNGEKSKVKLSWSDFFNILTKEFHGELYNVGIGFTPRKEIMR